MSSRIVATAAGQRAGEDRESNDGSPRNLVHVSPPSKCPGERSMRLASHQSTVPPNCKGHSWRPRRGTTAQHLTGCSRCCCRGQVQTCGQARARSEEHTSELQSLMRNSYAVFCLKKKKK